MADIYDRLANFLDALPVGYPATECGVELRILRKLFTPEEAELATHLAMIEEEPRVIAYRANRPVAEVARMLDTMEKKGLVNAYHNAGQPTRYGAYNYVVGFFEGQVNHMDEEFVAMVEEYSPAFYQQRMRKSPPQMRTIPVGVNIPVPKDVMDYSRAEEIIRANSDFAVADCICRKESALRGKDCDKPLETCLGMDFIARSYVYTGRGRAITQEEALGLLKQAEEAGLVVQPANSQAPIFMCFCCGCCCGILNGLKREDKPASRVANPFWVEHNAETCSNCGKCVKRCQMEALTKTNGTVKFHQERCIGCGLCVSTCPTGSMKLVLKPAAQQPVIPKNTTDTYIQIAQSRDRLGALKMGTMLVKSKVDRLLAPR